MKPNNFFFAIVGMGVLLAWLASFPLPVTPDNEGMMRMSGPLPVPPGPLGAWVSLGLWWGFLVTAIFALITWIRNIERKPAVEHEHRPHVHHA